MLTIKDFEAARERLRPVLEQTRLIYSPWFSKECGNEIYIKPENLQKTGSFKIRGAYNKIAKLEEGQRTGRIFGWQPCPGRGICSQRKRRKGNHLYAKRNTVDQG